MFTIPLSAKLGLGAAAGLLLFGATTPAVAAMTPLANHAPSSTSATATAHANDKGDRRLIMHDYLIASAQVLDLSPEQLRKDLKDGMSLSQLAEAKGLTKDQFADRVAKAIKPLLDQAVDSHRLTQAQEDRFLDALAHGRVPLWDRHHHKAPATTPSPAA